MRTDSIFKLLFLLSLFTYYGCIHPVKDIESSGSHPMLQMKSVPSGLGVNIHFYEGNEKDYSMIEESGMEIVRMDVSWSGIEKEPGVYDFSKHDRFLSDLEKRNIRVLFIIDYGNPLYDEGLAPHTDEGRAAYARFCEALATHFAGKNIIWELWNEPNSDKFWQPKANVADYVLWCKTVVPVIRNADQGACIIAPATSDMDIPFLEEAFEKGLLEYIDGVSVHPYRNPKRYPETTCEEYENIKVLIDLYKPAGKSIPLISGEWGYSCFFVSPELQGKYLARQWLNNISSEIPVSIWYDWHDDGTDPLNAEHNFGTVTHDYHPKSAFFAMKTLILQLRGYRFIGRLSTGTENDYLLLFSDGKNYRLAAWATGLQHQINKLEGLELENGISLLGEKVQPDNSDSLIVSDSPAYYSLSGTIPEYVKLMEATTHLGSEEQVQAANYILGDNKSATRFAATLEKFLKEGKKAEQMAAYQILIKLAKSMEAEQEKALSLYEQILESPASNRVKREAIYRMAVLGDAGSKAQMEKFLYKPEFAGAASVYFMQAAYKFVEKKMFSESLESMFQATKVTGLRYGPERVLRKLREMGWDENLNSKEMAKQNGFVTEWKITNPLPNEETARVQPLFNGDNIEFVPAKTLNGEPLKWKTVEPDNIWGIIPLAEMFGKTKAVVYASCDITVGKDINAIFKAGTNDGVACWLNGNKVFENYVDRALTIDEDVFSVELKKGINHVLLEVANSGGNWEFCLRICNNNGMPLMSAE